MTPRISLKLGLLSFVAVGGCAQILGISDYDIDPKLDPDSGQGGGPSAQGGEGGGDSGGKASGGTAGSNSQAGEQQGGEPGQGGMPSLVGGAPGQGAAGQGAAGEGGAPPGELVPCDSADCCSDAGGTPLGIEMLEDGGFELGTAAQGDSPWTESSTNLAPLITNGVSEGVDPRAGTYLAFLAGLTVEVSDLQSEPLQIPADAGWFELSGYRWFELDSLDVANLDFMGIGLYSYTETAVLELPFFWSTAGDPGETTAWTRFEASWDAAPHAGENRYLMLRGNADDYADSNSFPASNYLLDSISLKIFRCYK